MNQLDNKKVGERIRNQREFLDYTREEFADMLSISTNFCRDIEIGAKGMSVQTLIKVSNILKMSVDYILFGQIKEEDNHNLLIMINSLSEDKRVYAEDILKTFIKSLD